MCFSCEESTESSGKQTAALIRAADKHAMKFLRRSYFDHNMTPSIECGIVLPVLSCLHVGILG